MNTWPFLFLKNGILDVTLLTENPTARVRNKERK